MNKRVIAVGFFDGVHKGHKALMDKAVLVADEKNVSSSVFTFKKHPDEVIFGKPQPLITTDCFREQAIKKYGNVDEVFFWEFNEQNAKMAWDNFVTEILFKKYNACHIITGEDFHFGYKGQGNSQNLAELCKQYGIGYDAIKPVIVDGVRVSSTHIRNLLSLGDIEQVNRFLAHPYEITGEVIHGRKLGRTIGFPTVNIKMPQDIEKIPKGVYITTVNIDGKLYKATTNVGVIPTFVEGTQILVEAHILGYQGDLYGKNLTVSFYKFLRPEKKFATVDELKLTIAENINQTRNYGGIL